MKLSIRLCKSSDIDELRRITVEGFEGIALDHNVEKALGVLAGHEWRFRKGRHDDEDVAANPDGVFIAELDGQVVGYISARLDRESKKGRIPNLVVDQSA